MKHFALKALLGISCLALASIAPLTANDESASLLQVDAVTCATPPVRPAKKQTSSQTDKQKKKAKKSKDSKTNKSSKKSKNNKVEANKADSLK